MITFQNKACSAVFSKDMSKLLVYYDEGGTQCFPIDRCKASPMYGQCDWSKGDFDEVELINIQLIDLADVLSERDTWKAKFQKADEELFSLRKKYLDD